MYKKHPLKTLLPILNYNLNPTLTKNQKKQYLLSNNQYLADFLISINKNKHFYSKTASF
jgi:hypothetical protein